MRYTNSRLRYVTLLYFKVFVFVVMFVTIATICENGSSHRYDTLRID